jgi:aspartyl-tRNA(Asn)/glutamyl-tRNA(Gln) amidotransferase subunit C
MRRCQTSVWLRELEIGITEMAISKDEVLHVARLARLELTDDEVARFTGQLSAILEAVAKVSELDLSDVEPTAHPLDVVNVWEADEPRPCLPVEEALANAPDREDDAFRVPPA